MVAYYSFHGRSYTVYNIRKDKSMKIILNYVLCKQCVNSSLNVTSPQLLLLLQYVILADIVWTCNWYTVSIQSCVYPNHFNYYVIYHIGDISHLSKTMCYLSQIKVFIWKQVQQCMTHLKLH